MPFSNKKYKYNSFKNNYLKTKVPIINENLDFKVDGIKANLWPYPQKITQGNNYYDFSYQSLFNNSSFNGYKQYLSVDLKNPLKDFDDYLTGLLSNKSSTSNNKLSVIKVKIDNQNTGLESINLNTYKQLESYKLNINEYGEVSIVAPTYIGIGYALITLQQLITVTSDNNLRIDNLPINISDSPNTYYRGNFLDVARTFFPVTDILSFIQFNGFCKLNFIDLHLTDNQSFPISVGNITQILSNQKSTDPDFKDMTGAFHKYYTLTDINQIIDTAKNYGIAVIPGFDIPGHCSSMMYGSKQSTKDLFNKEIQIIKYWQANYQKSTNAPEPIIGYLDLENPNISIETIIIPFIAKILDELLIAFKIGQVGYGNKIDLNLDEVSINPKNPVVTSTTYITFLNALFNFFKPEYNSKLITEYNSIYKNNNKIITKNNIWTTLTLCFWIDPIIELNISGTGNDIKYTNNVDITSLSHRINLGLWNLWPAVMPSVNNLIIDNLPNCQCRNVNSNIYYMDAGAPGSNYNGLFLNKDITDSNAIKVHSNSYWINQIPIINSSPYSGDGYKGWIIPWVSVYTNNIHWDYNSSNQEPLVWNGMKKLKNMVGASIANWTETISPGNINYKLILNTVAFSESVWKYNPDHLPDNVKHATLRIIYMLNKLEGAPYNIINTTKIYDDMSHKRLFPMGSDMSKAPKLNKGNIKQEYLTKYYPNWNLNIATWRDKNDKEHSFEGYINNDLMYNINPDGVNGSKAILQNPLNMVLLYSQQESDTPDSETSLLNRINPFLAEDIDKYFKDNSFTGPMSNFSSNSQYHEDSPYYTDLRTQIIKTIDLTQ